MGGADFVWEPRSIREEKRMRYKIFGRRTGLRVSELALDAGNFGTRWGHGAERGEAKSL